MEGGAWWATVYGVAKSRTRLSDLTWLDFTSIVSKTLRTQYTLAVAIVFVLCFGALPQSFMVETSRNDVFTYGSQWAVVHLDLQFFAEQKPSQQSVLLTVKHPISSPLILIFRKVSCVKVCTTMRHPLKDPSIVICWALYVELKNPKLFLPSSYLYHSHSSDRAGYSPWFTTDIIKQRRVMLFPWLNFCCCIKWILF